MSVAKLRSSFEKKGCQIALWVLMVGAALAIAGTGFMGCFADQSGLTRNAALDIEVLKINGQSVSLAAVTLEITNQRQVLRQQNLAFGGFLDQSYEYEATVNALGVLVQTHVVGAIARSRGVTIDESTALAMAGQQLDQQIFQFRFQAQLDGDLRQDATEQEFQDYFLEEVGRSASEFKEQSLDSFRKQLQNPEAREAMLVRFSLDALSLNFFSTTAVTEDEVRRSFETLSLKVISFDDFEKSVPDRQADAEKALAELKGGAGFDAVMRKYMDSPVTEPTEMSRTNLDSDENLKVLNDLEPGQDSAVVLAFGSLPSIYRLIEVKSDIPEDFEDNLLAYTNDLRRIVSQRELNQAIDAGTAAAVIEWSSAGYEAIYKLSTMSADQEDLEIFLREVVDTDFNLTSDPAGPLPGILARFTAMEQLRFRLSEDERKEMLELQAEIILDFLSFTENVRLRLTLVDLYGEQEMRTEQADALLTAAKMNRGIDPINQIYFNQINDKLKAMEDEELIDSETAGEIHKALLAWSEDMADVNRAAAEAAAAVIDLDKFNIDPLTGDPVNSGDDGSEPDESTDGDTEESDSGDG